MKNFLIVIIFSLFVGTVVYSAPSAGPLGSNISVPLTQLDYSQVKEATLAVNDFMVGDWRNVPTALTIFTGGGKLGIKMPITDLKNLPTITDTLEVGSGGVRLAEISTAGVQVCADSQGTLVKCQTASFSHSGDDTKAYETYTYKVPTGVTKITVELYGAGGAGYFDGSTNFDRSPDNHSGCGKTSGGNYNCGSGGSAFFYDTNGSTPILQAKGGQVATGKHTAGKGGTKFTGSHPKIISVIKNEDGGDGGPGDNGKSSDTSQTFNCGTDGPYTATIGGNGGLGGYGGRSSSAGGLTPGGNGGRGGFSLFDLLSNDKCLERKSLYEGKGSLSMGGSDGQFGAGGSGAGGIGGFSDKGGDLTYSSGDALCSYSGANCSSAEQGYAGGGGGGYTKAQLDVKGGETYTLKLSHGGEVQGITENKGTVWCYYVSKWTCNGGSYSGNGSGAYAKVTVN
jgi:hypothetical protein